MKCGQMRRRSQNAGGAIIINKTMFAARFGFGFRSVTFRFVCFGLDCYAYFKCDPYCRVLYRCFGLFLFNSDLISAGCVTLRTASDAWAVQTRA